MLIFIVYLSLLLRLSFLSVFLYVLLSFVIWVLMGLGVVWGGCDVVEGCGCCVWFGKGWGSLDDVVWVVIVVFMVLFDEVVLLVLLLWWIWMFWMGWRGFGCENWLFVDYGLVMMVGGMEVMLRGFILLLLFWVFCKRFFDEWLWVWFLILLFCIVGLFFFDELLFLDLMFWVISFLRLFLMLFVVLLV